MISIILYKLIYTFMASVMSLVREESSSTTRRNNRCGPAARRKKTDFEHDIGEFGVQLPLPIATWKLPH